MVARLFVETIAGSQQFVTLFSGTSFADSPSRRRSRAIACAGLSEPRQATEIVDDPARHRARCGRCWERTRCSALAFSTLRLPLSNHVGTLTLAGTGHHSCASACGRLRSWDQPRWAMRLRGIAVSPAIVTLDQIMTDALRRGRWVQANDAAHAAQVQRLRNA